MDDPRKPHPSPRPPDSEPAPARPGPVTLRLIAACRARIANDPRCPTCGHTELLRWGRFSGRQRYRCRGCGVTFSDFTGTPLAHLKATERWPDFVRCMVEVKTVRAAARRSGIDRTTSHRWRHRLLGGLDSEDRAALGGVLAFSEAHYPTTRFSRARMLIARDSAGITATAAVGPRPRVDDLVRALGDRLDARALLVGGEGRFGVLARFAAAAGVGYRRVGTARDGALRPAADYLLRFRRWLCRFRGVGVRYLRNYLAWHRFLEAVQRLDRETARRCLELWAFP